MVCWSSMELAGSMSRNSWLAFPGGRTVIQRMPLSSLIQPADGRSYQPSSRSRSSPMPKWCATSWMTVRRTWSATSCSLRLIAQIAWL